MSLLPATFKRSTLTAYLNTASSVVVALVTVPLLTDGLGTSAYGVWVLVGSTVLYLELLEFGFGATTIQYVASAKARGDEDEVRTAITTSFWLLAVPGAAALLLSLVLVVVFPMVFDVGPGLESATRVLLLLLAVDLALSIPCDVFGGALIAHQRLDLLNWTLVSVTVLQACGWAIVLATGGGLVGLGIVTVSLSLVAHLWRWLLVRRMVPGLSLNPRRAARRLVRPYAGSSFWYSLGEFSEVVIARMDTIVVGIVVGVPAAGVYGVGQKLALLASKLTSPALATFFPHAAHLSARGDEDGLRSTTIAATRIATVVALPLALVLAAFAAPAIEVWVGPEFAEAAEVVVYLSLATAVASLGSAGQLVLYGTGAVKGVGLVSAAEAVLNLVLSVVLARRMGLSGVALATLITAVLANVGGIVPYLCRQLGLLQRQVYGPVLRAHVPAAAVSLGLAAYLLQYDLDRLLPLAAAAGASGLAYVVVLSRTGLDAQERADLRRRLRRKAAA